MFDSLGARLRRHREKRNITLTSVAGQTKIKLSLLEELERDNLAHWPTGIFRRAFVRSYAAAVGLEPGEVLREFLAVHPDPIQDASTVIHASDHPALDGVPPTRLSSFVGSVMGRLSERRSGIPKSAALSRDDLSPPAETSAAVRPSFEPDFRLAADLCTRIAQLNATTTIEPLLQQVATLLGAAGLVVWVWDAAAAELKPVVTHGYSEEMLARLPAVRRDADNATATAFRSARTCVVKGSGLIHGALTLPLMTPGQCVGVLAVELRRGYEQIDAVRVLATILAAQLATLLDRDRGWAALPVRADSPRPRKMMR